MLKICKTENGLVRGLPGNNARISVFKGIPFAAPPVGENRWKAPQPASNWEGVRDCYKFAPISIQDTPGLGTDVYCKEWHVDPEIEIDEDNLYLNIWTPAKTTDEKLPVLVWFFGGAFQWGYPPEMEFNGENLAKKGIIVVTVNYRLGALGFLAHPDIKAEAPDAPSNFGLLDQQTGLKWVIRNIENFGGDPSNITIAGQSAGGGSTLSHVTSDKSKGLFQRAIIYSGIIESPYFRDGVITPKTFDEAAEFGKKFFELLGVNSLEEARKLDATFIRDKQAEFRNTNGFFFTPVIDGVYLEGEPFKRFVQGKHAHVPVLAGNTEDEFPSYIFADSEADFKAKAQDIFGDKTSEFLAFPEANTVENNNCYARSHGIEASVKAALAHNSAPSYYYSFETDIPGEDNPGTFHSVDLWFFFDNLQACWRPFEGRHYDLARHMSTYVTNFIKSGDPNGTDANGKELTRWNPYSKEYKNEMRFTSTGCKATTQTSKFVTFISEFLETTALGEAPKDAPKNNLISFDAPKKQAFNPYLPSWEYIPDGEPYVFDGRVYVYGSHDKFNGHAFCLNDYVCWSAPVDDLGNWTYEGVTFGRLDEPDNYENRGCLYAPDVTKGPDGRYYLFYVIDRFNYVSVAVCDTPAGKYEFLGYVHYEDGTRLGLKPGDEPQFDPGVITVGKETFLYTGFCGHGDKSRHGCMLTVLDEDMLTIKYHKQDEFLIPGAMYAEGTDYEGHAFFEAPSIRERNGIYYLIYSSQVMHELCYGMSDSPYGPFKYGGVIVSNCDIGIDSYKPADFPTCYGANNHGSMVQINDDWYIFYHRHTSNTWYARQGCVEKLAFTEDGHIIQAEITSCGLNNGPLNDVDEYPSYIVCNIFDDRKFAYVGEHEVAYVTQEGRDGDENVGYVCNIHNGTTLGYKYFNFKGVKGIELVNRGYGNGVFEIRTEIGGEVLATLPNEYCTVWETHRAELSIPDGVHALYITYNGDGNPSIKSFKFLH